MIRELLPERASIQRDLGCDIILPASTDAGNRVDDVDDDLA